MSDPGLSSPPLKEGAESSAPDATDPAAGSGAVRVLVVTGMSGAGKSSSLKALEDMGYEAVDNLPLALLENMVAPGQRPLDIGDFNILLAIGIDIRTRDFSADAFLARLDELSALDGVDLKLLFLDCDDDELRRRYTETRRRHPLALDRPVSDGIAHERRIVSDVRERAHVVLDTTGLELSELKRVLRGHFAVETAPGLAVFVTSFAFPRGLPREADLVFDVRFLANPHYDAELRDLTGLDAPVADYIAADEGFAGFFDGLTGLLRPLLPRYAAEGKSYLTIAVGCTGGRHRSVFVARKLAEWLKNQDQRVHLGHRDLNRTRA